ncbi:MAG: ATP-binding protein [Campylobacterota bacterium]
MKRIDIKKELSEEEFKEILVVCELKFKEIRELSVIALDCENKTKEITPATEAFVLFAKPDTKEYELVTLNKKIPMNLDVDSILSECYKTKQPLLVNDATRSFLFNEKDDNFLKCDIEDLLLVPILDDSSEKNVLAIIWSTITKGGWNQYTQKDVNYMVRFSIFFKSFLQEQKPVITDTSSDTSFLDCIDAYDKLSAKIENEQNYFSSIIHDIRTPMNAVMGFLELLNLREDDKDKKEYIQTALKSSETMVSLINDALDISKMANGKMSIEKIEFCAISTFSDVAKLFHNSAKKKKITLDVFFDPNIPELIYSDYHRIKQVMNNLLSNAIKFTPENGEINLELIYNKEKDGLTVSIKDSGVGIAKEMQKNIFTPYTQEKSSTSREYGGTGLGLSISQQLSVLLGGKLALESTEGKGSRFFFTIPCRTKKAKSSPLLDKQRLEKLSVIFYCPVQHNIATASTKRYLKQLDVNIQEKINTESLQSVLENTFDILIISRDDTILHEGELQRILEKEKPVIIIGNGYLNEGYHWFTGNVRRVNMPILPQELYKAVTELTNSEDYRNNNKVFNIDENTLKDKQILVVDDNSINLKFMREVFRTMNIKVTLAQTAEESMIKIEDKKFDIIFMDENMPTMQGSEVTSYIRKKEKEKNSSSSVIIGLTGDADKRTREMIINAGADEVLTKPVHIKNIKETIIKYL